MKDRQYMHLIQKRQEKKQLLSWDDAELSKVGHCSQLDIASKLVLLYTIDLCSNCGVERNDCSTDLI